MALAVKHTPGPVKQAGSPQINPSPYNQSTCNKRGKNTQYEEKAAPSISGAGKTGELHIKKWN